MSKKLFLALIIIVVIFIPTSVQALDFSKADIGIVRTELPKAQEINVCVSDVDEHGEIVSQYVHKYFDGHIAQLPYSSDYIPFDFHLCNVINFSIGYMPIFLGYSQQERQILYQKFREEEYYLIHRFLQYYDGIIVESAGNEDDMEDTFSSPIARFKEWNTDESMNDRLFVIGQIEINEYGEYIHHFSYGEQIDFVVPNYDEMVNGVRYSGTSFSAPVFTGVVSTVLQAGIPIEDLRSIIGYEEDLHVWENESYKVFSVLKTFKNAYKYLEINN